MTQKAASAVATAVTMALVAATAVAMAETMALVAGTAALMVVAVVSAMAVVAATASPLLPRGSIDASTPARARSGVTPEVVWASLPPG